MEIVRLHHDYVRDQRGYLAQMLDSYVEGSSKSVNRRARYPLTSTQILTETNSPPVEQYTSLLIAPTRKARLFPRVRSRLHIDTIILYIYIYTHMYTEKEDKEQRRPLSVTWWKSKGKDDVDNSQNVGKESDPNRRQKGSRNIWKWKSGGLKYEIKLGRRSIERVT